jgi:hypothetical protein
LTVRRQTLLKVWQVNFVVGKTREGTFNKKQQLATKDLTSCVQSFNRRIE